MLQSKHSISTSHIKKKDLSSLTPFDSNIRRQYLTSSRKKSNESLFDFENQGMPVINNVCLKHSFSISNMCFSCNYQLMCSQCLKSQNHLNHKDHDIRTIQKASNYIRNFLTESSIKLDGKCNILTILNQQITDRKIQMYSQCNDYKETLSKTFENIHNLLQKKQKQFQSQIDQIYHEHLNILTFTVEEIKRFQRYYQDCRKNISRSLDKENNDLAVCFFYSQKKHILDEVVSEIDLIEFKKKIYQVKYKIQNGDLDKIRGALHALQIQSQIKYTHFQLYSSESRPSSLKKLLLKVKSQDELNSKALKRKIKKSSKYFDIQKTEKINFAESRYQKQRQSHKVNGTFCLSTPKQLSPQKKFDAAKKSSELNAAAMKKRKKSSIKNISMPASPAKQQKNSKQRLSPTNFISKDTILEGMKKKTLGLKKKK